MTGESLAGRLLVSTPQIEDGVFHRSVVLMLQHDDESGAQGLVLNKPLDAGVDAVLPEWQPHVTAPGRLFHGGPVQLDSALGLVSVPGDVAPPVGVRRLFDGVGVVDLDSRPADVVSRFAGMRIFAGYAGWVEGQLESEIRRGGWFVVDAESRDGFTDDPSALWSHVLRRQGGQLAWVAAYPPDPEQN